jgi:hypothetical protein
MKEILTTIVWILIVAVGYLFIKTVIGTDFIFEAILTILLLILAILFSGRIASFFVKSDPEE